MEIVDIRTEIAHGVRSSENHNPHPREDRRGCSRAYIIWSKLQVSWDSLRARSKGTGIVSHTSNTLQLLFEVPVRNDAGESSSTLERRGR